MINYARSNKSFTRCGKYTFTVIVFWTIWCLLMLAWPQIFALPAVRAVARVAILFIPTIIFYLRGNREKTISDYFLLRENWVRGVILGGGFAILYFSVEWWVNFDVRQGSFHFPAGFAIWFNFIVGSPLAEELFFRGILLKELKTTIGTVWATLISSLAFALFHLPQWVILDSPAPLELLTSFMTLFLYGVIFALLVNLTKSLWGSLVPHWINNFILLAIS